MESTSNESRIILAIEALKNDPKLTERAAAGIYKVPRATLADRRAGKLSRRDITANGRKLTNTEESVLLDRIIDLIERGVPPRLEDIQDMANRLLGVRDATRVGSRRAGNFVRRQPALNMRFRRRIDYQRAYKLGLHLYRIQLQNTVLSTQWRCGNTQVWFCVEESVFTKRLFHDLTVQ
jgi:hypothetical protein